MGTKEITGLEGFLCALVNDREAIPTADVLNGTGENSFEWFGFDELVVTQAQLDQFQSELNDIDRCTGCGQTIGWDICCDHLEELRTDGHNSFLNDYEDCRF
jgi:hypothetical protein